MDIQPGATVTIANDILANNQIAFQRGEQVVIESVSPNPQQPDYKYVVLSRLGTRYQLRDIDIVVPQAYQQPVQQPYMVPQSGYAEKKKFPAWGIVLIVVGSLLILGLIGLFAIPVMMSGNSAAKRRTCQANLRTIDGAINTYNAEYDTYPTSMDQLVPDLIKRMPTCPVSGEEYTLDEPEYAGEPPSVSCPTGEEGHSIY